MACATAALKLHFDPFFGMVWMLDGAAAPVDTGMTPGQFVAQLDVRETRAIRLLGCRQNAALITLLRARFGDAAVIEVGRPGHVDWAALEPEGPAAVLLAIHQIDADAPSRGGWHRLGCGEAAAYAMADQLAHGRSVQECMPQLEAHPAYPALSFITRLDESAVVRLVAAILDPRWFIDPNHPDRAGRLKSYLGLDSLVARGSTSRRDRRQQVMAAWRSGEPRIDPTAPGDFLWRYWGGCYWREQNHARADLATARHFLDFLRWSWLDALHPQRRAWQSRYDQGLFVPEHYFKIGPEAGGGPDYATAAAFRRHMADAAGDR
jgi:hypothetical protein